MPERILIMGAGASQGLFGETLTDPEVLGADRSLPELVFYDPRPDVWLQAGLSSLHEAWRANKVQFLQEVPSDPNELFDVAIIASSSGMHAAATQAVLDRGQEPLPLFVTEKPLAATPEELAWFQRIDQQYPHLLSISNEPYLLSEGVNHLLQLIEEQEADNNALQKYGLGLLNVVKV